MWMMLGGAETNLRTPVAWRWKKKKKKTMPIVVPEYTLVTFCCLGVVMGKKFDDVD